MAAIRYQLDFGPGQTGLAPTFVHFQRMDTWAEVTPPAIVEPTGGDGRYYFDWDWTVAAPVTDISFRVGVLGGAISSSDAFVPASEADTQAIMTRLGVPSVSVLADTLTAISSAAATTDAAVAGVQTAVNLVSDKVTQALGLMYDNSVLDQQTYDGNGNLLTARLRTYDTNAHAVSAGATGLLKTYSVYCTYDVSGNQTLFRITEV